MRSLTRALGIVALLLTPAMAEAQGKLQSGVEAGVLLARFGGDDADGAKTRIGLAGGGFLRFPLGRIVALEPALIYASQGTKAEGGGITNTYKLEYWQVPLRLRFTVPTSGALRPWVYVAPAIALRDRCRLEIKQGNQSLEADCNDRGALGTRFNTKALETSVHLGAGLEYGRIQLGVRYQYGLSTVDNSDPSADLHNRVFAIVGGYRFGGPR